MATITEFATTPQGTSVRKVVLNSGDLAVSILTFGAILQSVRLAGVPHDLTIGSDDFADYLGPMHYHGALVAPVANRISGAQADIAGTLHRFEANQADRITLHSGSSGAHAKVWDIADHGPAHVTLSLDLPAGLGGFPGNRQVRATFRITDRATLRLDILATTDAPTLFNAVNHSYWNLDGTPDWSGHQLQIAAEHYLPTTADVTPTGEIAAVTGTPFDLTRAHAITPQHPALDTNFCLSTAREPLRDVLWLTGTSGLAMTVATTEPGIQVFDGRNPRPGHAPYQGLAIEPQCWPDAPHNPAFPSIVLNPDAAYHQTSEWRFSQP
jgi:aldose 1-epimerase